MLVVITVLAAITTHLNLFKLGQEILLYQKLILCLTSRSETKAEVIVVEGVVVLWPTTIEILCLAPFAIDDPHCFIFDVTGTEVKGKRDLSLSLSLFFSPP